MHDEDSVASVEECVGFSSYMGSGRFQEQVNRFDLLARQTDKPELVVVHGLARDGDPIALGEMADSLGSLVIDGK
jgi:hypothetical protein